LERVKALVADQQWDEVVETLRQVMENYGSKVIAMTDSRYISVADYCHLQIASLPAPALNLYRQRVDPLAQKLYSEGIAQHDQARLTTVASQFFCSTRGADALWALGEMALEQGDYGAARGYWKKLIEMPPDAIPAARFEAIRKAPGLPDKEASLLNQWYELKPNEESAGWMEYKGPYYRLNHDLDLSDQTAAELVRFWKSQRLPLVRLAYPETTIPLAGIRARLVLCSIMEGSLDQARMELASFARRYPQAKGPLEGRSVVYAEGLSALLASAEKWPQAKSCADWPTFAGSNTRTKIAPPLVELGALAWPPIVLGEPLEADGANQRAFNYRRVGEDLKGLLSYHPLVVGDLLLVCNRNSILAFNVKTGKPAWPTLPSRAPGEIHSDTNVTQPGSRLSRVGVPRFTMTAHAGRLYACMGSQITNRPFETFDNQRGYLICLDLATQGKLVWPGDGRLLPDDDKWAFEGAPLVDGGNVYVAMRRSDVRPQAHVACYDADTARLRWRTFVCSAEGPGGGQVEEMTHSLLTLDHGVLYFNTNLGAVAAINARDGQLQWATLYPRAGKMSTEGNPSPHFFRDLNPCIFYRGMLFAAPSDSRWVFSLDASTGQFRGATEPNDVVHLLGVGGDNLIASGTKLWWIDVNDVKLVHPPWPEDRPYGKGRGLLAGDAVVWPTATELFILSQKDGPRAGHEPVRLYANEQGSGGNLLITDKLLIVATSDKLFAYERRSGEKKAPPAGGKGNAGEGAARP